MSEPNSAQEYFTRGLKRYGDGDIGGAFDDFSEAISLNPNFAQAFYNRGNIIAEHYSGYGAAFEDYDDAIRCNPRYVNAYFNRGLARQDKGDQHGAEQDFAEAKRLGRA